MIALDVNNPDQVKGPRLIDVDLGQSGRRMLILSGIACPEFRVNDDEHIYRETCTVNLRRTVLAVDQATVSVGLASIDNDDTDFLLALDNARVDIDPVTQELLVTVDLAAMGEETHVHRFGYQVVATVTTQATGISGHISWDHSIFDAGTLSSAQVAQMFRVSANRVETMTPPPGQMGFAWDKYIPVAYGVTAGIKRQGGDYVVPYEIPGAPYGQDLVVQVEIGMGFKASNPVVGQVAGPRPVKLTVAAPGVSGVDFRVTSVIIR